MVVAMFRYVRRGLSGGCTGTTGLTSGSRSGKDMSSSPLASMWRRSSRRRRRRECYERLRGVLRVNNPEADMRPILPFRAELIAEMERAMHIKETRRKPPKKRTAKSEYYNGLRERGREAALRGDLKGVSAIMEEARGVNYPLDRDLSVRLALVAPVVAVARNNPKMASAVLTQMTTTKLVDCISKETLGQVLDIYIRGLAMSKSPERTLALRGVSLSTMLDIPLGRPTYNALMRLVASTDVTFPLALFYRALQKSVQPNIAMYNAVLLACFKAVQPERAQALMEEIRAAGVRPNGDTFNILLLHTETVAHVDSLLSLYKKLVSKNVVHPSQGHAQPFIRAYIANRLTSPRYLSRAFEVIDTFHDLRVGPSSQAITEILKHCLQDGNVEGALHALRELRKGWYAPPPRRMRHALTRLIAQRDVPERLLHVIKSFESVADSKEMDWIVSVREAFRKSANS